MEPSGRELGQLLEDIKQHRWPANHDAAAWAALANWAFQQECLAVDKTENAQWEHQMRDLARRGLPYPAFTAERMAALKYRIRARKLAQANLRYKYGFRNPRPPRLIRAAVTAFYVTWSGE
ncbi:hypothetical protein [Agromyces sp. NPDC058104]|uniref:hypothetical protein n=1 Tax=Agromyces sp. NPDC058104 TaxID=3346342 RepID=UPI0036D88BB2